MSSLLLRRSLLLPPAIRTSTYQSSLQRSSISPLRRHASTIVPPAASEVATTSINPVAETLMALPSLLLDTLHSAGLPWWSVLPLTALIVRGGIIYHLSTLPARRRAILRRNLVPVVGAQMRRAMLQREIEKKPVFRPWLYLTTMASTSRDFKLSLFNFRSLLNFGVLITFSETIRVKCGAREGVLNLITQPLTSLSSKNLPLLNGEAPKSLHPKPLSPEEILAQRLFDVREAQAQVANVSPSDIPLDPSLLTSGQLTANPYAAYIEPSMRTEGLPAFIPDLTLPDPTFTLPCLLTLTMAAGILLRRHPPASTPGAPSSSTTEKPPLTLGQQLGLSVAMLFGMGATQFPAAILLYLVPNMGIAWLQGRWLDVKYPIPGTVEPCRKPIRVKVRKEFDMPI